MANTSSAYDLSKFEYSKSKPKATGKISSKKIVNIDKALRRKNVFSAFGKIFAVLVVIVMFTAIIACNVSLNEINDEIRTTQSKINKVDGETIRMNMELEKKTNLNEIEKYAKDVLKMSKLDRSAIEYVGLKGVDKIEIYNEDEKETGIKYLLSSIVSGFNIILEYLK